MRTVVKSFSIYSIIIAFLVLPLASLAGPSVVPGQESLLSGQVNSLQGERRGVTDVYFIGFAPYAGEDVFLHEATYVRNLFDLQYDTLSRSALLVNNEKSLNLYPVATLENLRRVFDKTGSIINPDEDIVVFYITSHGAEDKGIEVKFENSNQVKPDIDYLDAETIKRLFDDNNIRFRVIIALSCFSGGLIDVLKNENALIITSASKHKPSFGCGHHGDFTQFGEAYFKNELGRSKDLITSFTGARLQVEILEKKLDLSPSEPQIFIGKNIRSVLDKIMH
jgi:hypothetical protein